LVLDDRILKDEGAALRALLGRGDLLALILQLAAKCRAAAIKSPALKLTDSDLIEFVAV
jgi:hypothetical protein